MKRSLIFSLCLALLASFGISSAQADVDVALNLNYTDPADPNAGGSWTLVAKTDTASSNGITSVVVRFGSGTIPAAGTVNGSIGHDINGGALVVGDFPDPNGYVEFVYGQDPNDGLVGSVGLVGSPSNQGTDPLDPLGVNGGTWDDASIIATGSFLSSRPTAVLAAANEDIGGTISSAVIGDFNIRGDSVSIDGLLPGDTNRDWSVNNADFAILAGNWQSSGGWNDGDFNSDGNVENADFALLAGNWQGSNPPPAIGAVPEPTTVSLFGIAIAGLLTARRRS